MKFSILATSLILALASGTSFASPDNTQDTADSSGTNGGYTGRTTHRMRSHPSGTNNVGTDADGSASSGGSASDQSGTSMGGSYTPSTGTGGNSGAAGSSGGVGR